METNHLEHLLSAVRAGTHAAADAPARHAAWVAARTLTAALAPAGASEPVYLTSAPLGAALCEDAQPAAPPPVAAVSCAPPEPTAASMDDPAPAEPHGAPPSPPPPAASPPPPAVAAPRVDPAAMAQLLGPLRHLPPEQLLDLAIAKLRAALPDGVTVAPSTPIRFQLIPLQHLGRLK